MTATTPRPEPVTVHPYPARRVPKGSTFLRMLRTTDPKDIGILYLVTCIGFFLIGGAMALLMRGELAVPEQQFLSNEDDRILRATEQLLLRGVADITLLGREDEVRGRAAALGLDVSAARIIDPVTSPLREPFARVYTDLRRHRGITGPVALDLMADATYFGTMMVQQRHANGLVSGAARPTPQPTRSGRRSR